MLKTLKYRIYPNKTQEIKLSKIFGSVRFVYNLGLETKLSAYASTRKNLSCFDLNKQITDLKKDLIWLKETPSQALQMSMQNLDNAFTTFFKGQNKFPNFKKKSGKQSFQLPQGTSIEGNKIFIPKLKWVSIVLDKRYEKLKDKSLLKTCTISKSSSGKYFITLLMDTQKEVPTKVKVKEKTSIGIDLGINHLAILSDGTKIDNPRWYRELESRLEIEIRRMDRRKKKVNERYSKNYLKSKNRFARIHEQIKFRRKDFLDKLSTQIVNEYDTIFLENLDIIAMSKRMEPIQDATGKFLPNGQTEKSGLNKSILDAGWGMFVGMLEYKAEWFGKNVLKIGQFDPSSKLCSSCGTINKELTLADREWICSKCGAKHDRDINAAVNIKNFGLRNWTRGLKLKS